MLVAHNELWSLAEAELLDGLACDSDKRLQILTNHLEHFGL